MKQTIKKSLCAMVAAVMLVCMTVIPAKAASTGGVCGDVSWTYSYDTGTMTISKKSGTILTTNDTMKNLNPKKIVISSGITEIGGKAFSGWNITSVSIPDGVVKINWYAFQNCRNLKEITIPKTVKEAGYLFDNSAVEKVTFASGMKVIPDDICSRAYNLKTVVMPNSVTEIGGSAFSNSGISSIKLHEGITKINWYAFKGCENLKEITIPKTVKEAGYLIDDSAVEKITFASGMKVIPDDICSRAYNLKTVVMPSSVTEIGGSAFSNSGISSIKLHTGITKINWYAFKGCKNLKKITIPKTVKEAGYLIDDSAVEKVTFSTGIKEIPSDICSRAYNLKTVVIPSTVEKIGNSAFRSSSIENIVLPKSLKEIDWYAFENCEKLKSVKIYGDTTVGLKALNGCSKVTISGYVNSDAWRYAKENNISFKKIGTLPKVGYKKSLSGVTYKVTKTGMLVGTVSVVKLDKNQKSVTIPATVTFNGCTFKVTEISAKAFYKKTKLKTINIKSNNIKSIGKNAFTGINKKATIVVPKAKYSAYKKLLKSSTGYKKTMTIKKK